MFPVRIVQTDVPDTRTADCGLFGYGENGLYYAIKEKGVGRKKHLPITEWFCSCLATKLAIPTPHFDLLRLDTGALAFGSRWEAALLKRGDYGQFLFTKNKSTSLAQQLSKIHFLDLFVNNIDRHPNNYLARPVRDGSDQCAVFAFDYSRSLLINDFPPKFQPMERTSNTIITWKVLSKIHGVSETSIEECAQRITKIEVFDILDGAPNNWLSRSMRDKLTKWWNTNRKTRADMIYQHLCKNTPTQS